MGHASDLRTFTPFVTSSTAAAVSQILKSTSDIDITKALTTYFDTPESNILPSPAKLFYCKQINNRLSMADSNSTDWSAKVST